MASIWARYLAEFIGTYLLVIIIACNAVASSSAWSPLYTAGAVTALTYSLYNVSYAHLNPAVSVAFGVAGKMSWRMVGIYIFLQFVAAVLGAATFAATLEFTLQTTKSGEYGWGQAALVEVLFSTMFCFVFLNAATSKSEKDCQHYGFAIGLALLAATCAGNHITGSVLNPAVSLGYGVASSIWKTGGGMGAAPLFIVLDLTGAALGAVLFKACGHDEEGFSTEHSIAHRALAEFVGTFYLVLVVGLSVVRGTAGRAAEPLVALAAVLASMIFALGDISGAHFNPAATLAVMTSSLSRCSHGDDGPVYVVAQFVAGIGGAVLFTSIEHGQTIPLPWGKDFAWLAIAIAEGLFTMLLAFVVLSVSADSAAAPPQADIPLTMESTRSDYDGARPSSGLSVPQEYAGLAVGLAAVTGGVSVGSVSGGILNPALAAGVAFTRGGSEQLVQLLVYVGFELVGGFLAARLFHLLRPSWRASNKALGPAAA